MSTYLLNIDCVVGFLLSLETEESTFVPFMWVEYAIVGILGDNLGGVIV